MHYFVFTVFGDIPFLTLHASRPQTMSDTMEATGSWTPVMVVALVLLVRWAFRGQGDTPVRLRRWLNRQVRCTGRICSSCRYGAGEKQIFRLPCLSHPRAHQSASKPSTSSDLETRVYTELARRVMEPAPRSSDKDSAPAGDRRLRLHSKRSQSNKYWCKSYRFLFVQSIGSHSCCVGASHTS